MIGQIIWTIAAILLIICIVWYNIMFRKLNKKCNTLLKHNNDLLEHTTRVLSNNGSIIANNDKLILIVKDLQDKVNSIQTTKKHK